MCQTGVRPQDYEWKVEAPGIFKGYDRKFNEMAQQGWEYMGCWSQTDTSGAIITTSPRFIFRRLIVPATVRG